MVGFNRVGLVVVVLGRLLPSVGMTSYLGSHIPWGF